MTLSVDVLAQLSALLYSTAYWKGVVVAAGLTAVIFTNGGLYRSRRHLNFLDMLPGLSSRLLTCLAILAIVAAVRHDSVAYVGEMLTVMSIGAVTVLIGRAATMTAVRSARRRRWIEQPAVIVGGGALAIELAGLLRRHPEYGLRFAGFVDVRRSVRTRAATPLVGALDDLAGALSDTGAAVVIIADVACPDQKLVEIARLPAVASAEFWVVPRMHELASSGGDHIGAIPVARLRRPRLAGRARLLKRAFDVALAVIALAVSGPVMALCAVATWIEGGRGVLFHQQRVGRNGRPFDLVKFRTMRPGDNTEAETTWSIANDRRVGPVGRFLRRTSLDELPQLWNILRGDMTVVGPRPERPYFVDRFSADDPTYAMRHRAPVGLTGLAQVSGLRGDTPIADRARFDNYYIDNWSLWLDVKVLLRTVTEVARRRGS